jgi:hypothetical protein
MPKYRVVKIAGTPEYTGDRYQIQYVLFTLFGKEFWFNCSAPFPTEKSAVDYVKRLQTPYSEEVVWTSE